MSDLPALHEGGGLVFRALPPRAPGASADGAPVVVLLHGVGSNECDLLTLAPYIDARAAVVSVRGPLTLGPDAYAWFGVEFTPTGPVIVAEQEAASRAAIAGFVDWLGAARGVPAARIFLLGFSQGGIMTLDLALTRPHTFGGGLAYNIRLLPEILPLVAPAEQLAGMALFIAQTRADAVMRLAWSRDMHARLAQLRLALTYREYDGGHRIGAAARADGMHWLAARLDAPPDAMQPRD